MANRRMIASTIYTDEWFGPLDFFQQTLWIGLFAACADDQGRIQDNLFLIRSALFPYKDIPIAEIDATLAKFEADGKIIRYHADGKALIQMVNWWEHQRLQWASPSRFPAPDGWTDRIRTRVNGKYVVHNWNVQVDVQANVQVNSHLEQEQEQEQEQVLEQEQGTPVVVPEETRNGFFASPSVALETWGQACGGSVGILDVDRINQFVSECEEHRVKLSRGVPGADVSGEEWVACAIREANASKKTPRITLNYVAAILDNWQTNKFKARRDGNNGQRPAVKTERKVVIFDGEPPREVEVRL